MSGTRTLVHLALRRDRVMLPAWIIILGVLPASMASSYKTFYPTAAERAGLTSSIAKAPGVAVLYGRPFDLSTGGGFAAWRFGGFLALFVGLMSVFTVTRHTRAEEDSGRAELLASTAIGRHGLLTAAVIVSAGGSLAIGVVEGLMLMAAGQSTAGSWAMAAATVGAGLVFTAIAAVVGQLAEYSRTANGIGSAVAGVAFLIRAVGDSSTGLRWLSWLSPIGWAQQVRPFADERWWVLALPVVPAVVLTGVAFALVARRDVGIGLLPPKPGPARAAPSLSNPLALAWRLQRGVLVGWLVGMVVAGGVFGSIASGIGKLLGTSEQTRQVFERLGGSRALVNSYLAALAAMYGMIATLCGLQALMRLRSEETLRVEPLLATAVGRLRWAASHLVFVFGGSAVVLVAAGAATGFTNGLRIDQLGSAVADMTEAAAVQIPAAWLILAIGVAIWALWPRRTATAWGVAGVAVLISLFGPVLNVPHAVLDVSPFGHIPKLPGQAVVALPLLVLGALAVVALSGGLARIRVRDIG